MVQAHCEGMGNSMSTYTQRLARHMKRPRKIKPIDPYCKWMFIGSEHPYHTEQIAKRQSK